MAEEVFALLGVTLCAAALSAAFDMRRGIQKAVRLPDIVVMISDALFWVFVSFFTVWCLKKLNNGKIGIYEIAGFAAGSALYFTLLSKAAVRFFAVSATVILKIFDFIFKILLTPPRFLYKIIKDIFIKTGARKKEMVNNAGENY